MPAQERPRWAVSPPSAGTVRRPARASSESQRHQVTDRPQPREVIPRAGYREVSLPHPLRANTRRDPAPSPCADRALYDDHPTPAQRSPSRARRGSGTTSLGSQPGLDRERLDRDPRGSPGPVGRRSDAQDLHCPGHRRGLHGLSGPAHRWNPIRRHGIGAATRVAGREARRRDTKRRPATRRAGCGHF